VRKTAAILTLIAMPALMSAQSPAAKESETAAILAAVQKFFDTMASRDVEGARSVLMPDGRMFSVREQNGQSVTRASSTQDYLEGLAKRQRAYRERMWNPEVRVHGPIASVWTPYDFRVDGKFSHCGIDAFELVKTSEGWKISGGIYTVEPAGCAPSPLGPLK
jgi:Putative lumazine-binding